MDAEKKRTYCDSEAVVDDESGTYVWIVDEQDQVSRVDVVRGKERDGRVEIVQGLSGDERVVIAATTLRSGQRVKVIP